MPRITYQYIKEMKYPEIEKMKRPQLVKLLNETRKKTATRLRQLEKAKNIFSPAKQAFVDNVEQPSISKMTKKAILHELLQHRDFHKAKTSTVEGARKVGTEQDIRVFGVNEKTGRPKHRMKAEQRERFWSVYNEFLKTYKDSYARFGYKAIFEHLGEMHIKGNIKTRDEINTEDLDELLNNLENAEEAKEDSYDTFGPNVFSGRRSD